MRLQLTLKKQKKKKQENLFTPILFRFSFIDAELMCSCHVINKQQLDGCSLNQIRIYQNYHSPDMITNLSAASPAGLSGEAA